MAHEPMFWQYETGGELGPAVEAYLKHQRMTPRQVTLMRLYLVQWIESPMWKGTGLDKLRRSAADIRSEDDINAWLNAAMDEGIDPL